MFAQVDQVIPDEIAKRLAAQYAAGATTPLAVLYWTGRVLPTSHESLRNEGLARMRTTRFDTHKTYDPQGFEADMRALHDYFRVRVNGDHNGEHPDWDSVKGYGDEADTVVPWAYGKVDVILPWT